METFLLVLHIILSFTIVVVILLQSGQGGGLGAGFSNAAAMGQEVFGGRGAASFLGKLTVVLGASFMITSMALAWYSSKPQSALDLQMEADEPAQSQVHQIIEEGQGGGGDIDVSDMPAPDGDGEVDLQDLLDGDEESGIQIDRDEDQEIPAEIEEQLEGLEVETEPEDGVTEEDEAQAPLEVDVDEEPVEAEEPAEAEEPVEAEEPAESDDEAVEPESTDDE